MDLGLHFSARLEPFLLMSKSAKGAAAAKLVQDATSAPGVFVFAELLDLQNIQDLAKSEQHAPYLALLQIFSYKTYSDYLRNKDTLPALNSAQTTKLKHLSIVSLARDRRILPYAQLLQELQMPTIRELEDLIIDAIYLDILRGKLDQKEQQFEVEDTMGRDLEPGEIESVLSALQNWSSTTSAVLSTLDEKIATIASETASRKATNERQEQALQTTLREVLEKQKDKGRRNPYSSMMNDSMDIDEPLLESNRKMNRKAPQEPPAKQQRKRNRF
ncbi:hypothetical protein PLICRDRAFT_43887 [Plicaturopsis crispa FD-325 SS-3]|nr:hypothetical protein PLICRDRAFT_43887 [Plicaturopsis crispa FD-325 SS-3]